MEARKLDSLRYDRSVLELSAIAPLPILPVFNQTSLDRIFHDIIHDPFPFSLIANDVIEAFVLPELASSIQRQIALTRRPTFERLHYRSQRDPDLCVFRIGGKEFILAVSFTPDRFFRQLSRQSFCYAYPT